ncbi:helix-turn-helix transcriptional regulator [Denitromonas iodatirespirans]|uniref:HTH luxR-type domain-containing protein n=1 Tax=Denitromonas iodatirespirans TaxID=2795389 RepID=A0A944HAV3_DENI1|nr:hypothetical protein [Denitromonas iodatirespirans]MBT0963865.1 hypothetical protein [Denitromonas iodatirespirans]
MLLDLYACAGDASRWTPLLDGLCRETGACSAVIQSVRVTRSGLRLEQLELDSQSRQSHRSLTADLSADGNPRLELRRIARGLNRVVRDDDLFERGEIARHRLEDKLAEIGLNRFVGYLQQIDADRYLTLALHRAIADQADFSGDQVAWLSHFSQHVVQAFGLATRRRADQEANAAMTQVFDRLGCGILLCDLDGRVLWMNHSAEALLASDSALRLSADDCLRARRTTDASRLQEAIADVALAGSGGADRYLALGDSGVDALHLSVQPFRRHAQHPQGYAGSVLVAVSRTCAGASVAPAAVADLLGLTPAEGQLVSALVEGKTLEESARLRGVSIGTVRGQLKQVFSKTGVSRQAELVRVVLSSAAVQFVERAPKVLR